MEGVFQLCLSLIFPGWGVAAAYYRLNRNTSAGEVIVCSIFTSLLFVCLFAFALFATGYWEPVIFGLLIFVFSCGSFLILRGADTFRALAVKPLSLSVVFVALLLCLLSWGPPSEWITYSGFDAGKYSNHAGFMLRTGGIKVDKTFEELGLLQPSDYHYPKYYPDDPALEEFQLPFLHLFPAAMAVARNALGLENSLRINQFLSFTGLLILFALLRRFGFSFGWSVVGIFLLGTNPAFVFYAKRTMSEMLALNLVLGFFYFLSICDEFESRLFGFLSALTLFALATCRLEFGFIYCLTVLAIVCLRTLLSQPLGRGYKSFAISNFLLLFLLGGYYVSSCNFYIYRNTVWHFDRVAQLFKSAWRVQPDFPVATLLIFFNLLIFCIAAVFFEYAKRFSKYSTSSKLEDASRLISIAVACYLFYAWLGRPFLALSGGAGPISWDLSKQLSLPRLFYFVDPISVFSVALAGVYSFRNKRSAPFLIATMLFLLFGLINNYHSAVTIGWIRRFLPLVIPGCYISSIFLLSRTGRWGQVAVVFILTYNLCSTLNLMVGVVENPGAIKEAQQIKDSLGERPTTISFDGLMAGVLAVPLHSELNVPAVYLSKGLNSRKLALFEILLTAKKNLYIIHPGSGAEETFLKLSNELARNGFSLEKHLSQVLSLKLYDYFCEEWRPGRKLTAMFFPPGFYGLCEKEILFPVSIWKIGFSEASFQGSSTGESS